MEDKNNIINGKNKMSLKHSEIKPKQWYEVQRYKNKTHAGYLSYTQEVDGFVNYHFKWYGEMYHMDPVGLRDIICSIPEPRKGRRMLKFISKFTKRKK